MSTSLGLGSFESETKQNEVKPRFEDITYGQLSLFMLVTNTHS